MDSSSDYKVNSVYKSLIPKSDDYTIAEDRRRILNKLWSTDAPSKFLVHAWRVLTDCIPTRMALQQRGVFVFNPGPSCVLCFRHDEDIEHLSIHFRLSDQVWQQVQAWAGLPQTNCSSLWEHFVQHEINHGGKKRKKVRSLLWIAVVWVIWVHTNKNIFCVKKRNKIIFSVGMVNVSNIVNQIKLLSWGWFAIRVGRIFTLNYETWCNNPFDCLSLLE